MSSTDRLASEILEDTADRLDVLVRERASEPAQHRQGTALVALIRAEAGAARLTEAMFAAPGQAARQPAILALLRQSYPANVRAAVAYADTLTWPGSSSA